jgi:hypothetical protein
VKGKTLSIFLAVVLLEGILSLFGHFIIPSDSSKALLFGLSKMRLALLAIHLACILVTAVLAWKALFAKTWQSRLTCYLDAKLTGEGYLAPSTLVFAFNGIAGLLLIFWLASTSTDQVNLISNAIGLHFLSLHAVLYRLLPLIAWFSAVSIEIPVFLFGTYRCQYRQKSTWNGSRLLSFAVAWTSSCLYLVYWTILFFQLRVFEKIPGWYWPITAAPVTRRSLYFLLLAALALLVARQLLKKPERRLRNLALICFLALAFQVGIGFIDGKGLSSLADRYFLSHHRAYVERICVTDQDVLTTISHYENLYGGVARFTSTKPPGVMVIYTLLNKLVMQIDGSGSSPLLSNLVKLSYPIFSTDRCKQMASLITLLFPILALLTPITIFIFSDQILRLPGTQVTRQTAAILSVTAPNIVLLVLFLDQAFYPALFLVSGALTILAIRKQSPALSFIAGCVFYLDIFFSFSMTPLLALGAIYLVIFYWLNQETLSLKKYLVKTSLPAAAGSLASYAFFRFILGYDVIFRYKSVLNSMNEVDFHLRIGLPIDQALTLTQKILQKANAAFLNNLDFAAAVGLPIFLFFLVQGCRCLWVVLRKKAAPAQGVMAALFASFIALNIYAPMNGEAGRLWMFWVPVVSLLAGQEIEPYLQKRRWLFYLLLSAQVVTLAMIYLYQDLKMPQLLP